MSPRLRLLRPKGGAQTVRPADRHGHGLVVELAALTEVGEAVEVAGFEERRRPLTGVRGEDGRVRTDEILLSQVLAEGMQDLVPDPEQCVLAFGSQPEVAPVKEERRTVLLGSDRVGLRRVDHGKPARTEFHSAGSTGFGNGDAADFHGALGRTLPGGTKILGGHRPLGHHHLSEAGSVPEIQEQQPAARTASGQPTGKPRRDALRGRIRCPRKNLPPQGSDRGARLSPGRLGFGDRMGVGHGRTPARGGCPGVSPSGPPDARDPAGRPPDRPDRPIAVAQPVSSPRTAVQARSTRSASSVRSSRRSRRARWRSRFSRTNASVGRMKPR